jgi:hypothetical protein
VGSIASVIAFRTNATRRDIGRQTWSQIGSSWLREAAAVSAGWPRWPRALLEGFEWISVEGTRRMVRAPICRLMDQVSRHLSAPVRLAGKEVSI